MQDIEYKVDMNGSGFTPYFRMPPPKGITGVFKKFTNPEYWWCAYLEFKHDSCTTGYEQWYWEAIRFNTPKAARDFFTTHPDGFAYNDAIIKKVIDTHKGII